jgi:hypothetical protein
MAASSVATTRDVSVLAETAAASCSADATASSMLELQYWALKTEVV